MLYITENVMVVFAAKRYHAQESDTWSDNKDAACARWTSAAF
jgi:hypothetical protein